MSDEEPWDQDLEGGDDGEPLKLALSSRLAGIGSDGSDDDWSAESLDDDELNADAGAPSVSLATPKRGNGKGPRLITQDMFKQMQKAPPEHTSAATGSPPRELISNPAASPLPATKTPISRIPKNDDRNLTPMSISFGSEGAKKAASPRSSKKRRASLSVPSISSKAATNSHDGGAAWLDEYERKHDHLAELENLLRAIGSEAASEGHSLRSLERSIALVNHERAETEADIRQFEQSIATLQRQLAEIESGAAMRKLQASLPPPQRNYTICWAFLVIILAVLIAVAGIARYSEVLQRNALNSLDYVKPL